MADLLGKPCPLCEGIGQLPESAVDDLLRALAEKRGLRVQRKPEKRAPATDWSPVFDALSEARESLGFGPAVNTGSANQLRTLNAHSVAEWLVAIASQRESLATARLTPEQKNAYLSLQTIARNFDRCLQRASQQQSKIVRLSDGRWAEESAGQRRVLTTEEARSRGLAISEE